MTEKTVSWVSDISDPDQRGNRYINVAFTDGDTAYIGKKEYDATLEVQGLLEEAKLKAWPLDFTLEDTGKKNGKGKTKWKLKAFGEYQPTPYVQGSTVKPGYNEAERYGRTPEQFIYELEYEQERMDRRTALMQAMAFINKAAMNGDVPNWKPAAEYMYEWLRQTVRTQGHIEGEQAGSPTGHHNQGADSGQAGESDTGKVTSPACPPHAPDLTATPNKLGRVPCVDCGIFVKGIGIER